jgi:hypothetical protein
MNINSRRMLDLSTLLFIINDGVLEYNNKLITAIIDVRVVLSPCQSDLRVSATTNSYVTKVCTTPGNLLSSNTYRNLDTYLRN